MAEFFELSTAERLEARNAAASSSGRLPHLLERYLGCLCTTTPVRLPHDGHLVFKGGTSLSKAYGVIRRFSEDVDLTCAIGAIAGDLVGDADFSRPVGKSQEMKWSEEIRARLAEWLASEIAPRLKQDLGRQSLPASARAEDDKIFIDYLPLSAGTGYVTPAVMPRFAIVFFGFPTSCCLLQYFIQFLSGWGRMEQHQE